MKDFAHSRREFVPWKGDEARRAAFLSQLAEIIKRHTLKHVAVTLLVQVYNSLNEKVTVRESLGRPYTLTMLSSLILVRRWREENAPSEPIVVYVEHGDEDQGELLGAVKRIRYPYQVLPLRKRLPSGEYVQQFQAADYLAYEYHKNMKMMIERDGILAIATRDETEIQSRKSFHSLFADFGRDDYQRVISGNGIVELGKVFGLRLRSTT
jgi:hypothetical protein